MSEAAFGEGEVLEPAVVGLESDGFSPEDDYWQAEQDQSGWDGGGEGYDLGIDEFSSDEEVDAWLAEQERLAEWTDEPPQFERDERFDSLIAEAVADALAPFTDSVADFYAEPEPEPEVEVTTDDIKDWLEAAYVEIAKEHGELPPVELAQELSRLFSERLAADPMLDPAYALESSLEEATENAIGRRDGLPAVQKLVAAELFRHGKTPNAEAFEDGHDPQAAAFEGEVANLANDIVDALIQGGYDPQTAAAEAIRGAAIMASGTDPGAGMPLSPENLANYYGGVARGIREMETVSERAFDRQARAELDLPASGPVSNSAPLSPQQLATKYAHAANYNQGEADA